MKKEGRKNVMKQEWHVAVLSRFHDKRKHAMKARGQTDLPCVLAAAPRGRC